MKKIGLSIQKCIDDDLLYTLEHVKSCGYTSCELSLNILPFIIGDEICDFYVDYARNIISKIDLHYTAHGVTGLDLRSKDEFESHKKVLFNTIEVCSRLGVSSMTVHFEDKSKINWIENRLIETYKEASMFAKEKNVLLTIENIEIEDYNYVLDCIQAVNHENFEMTLDLGHLYLSCNYFDQDFMAAVKKCKPYVKNLHVNDNTGKFFDMRLTDFEKYKMIPMPYRTVFGLGDIHVPPFFGRLPLPEIFKIFEDKGDVIYTCEYERSIFKLADKITFNKMNEVINK